MGRRIRFILRRDVNFGLFIDLLVSRNAFVRRNQEEGDKGSRRNSGVIDVDAVNEWLRRRGLAMDGELRVSLI